METDEQFVERMASTISGINLVDWNRLSNLALRGAKVQWKDISEAPISGYPAEWLAVTRHPHTGKRPLVSAYKTAEGWRLRRGKKLSFIPTHYIPLSALGEPEKTND